MDALTLDQQRALAMASARMRASEATPARGWMDDVTGAMANVNRGLGIGDELAAGVRTAGNVITGKTPITDVGDDFKRSMATQRGQEDSFTAAHPHVAAAMRGTGNALTLAAPVGPGAEAFATGGRAINALRGATVAGLTGAGYAAVDRGTLAERGQAAASAAHDPLTLGLGAVGGAMAVPSKPKARRDVPTLEDLTAQKNAAYKAVDDSGITIPADDFANLTTTMADAMDKEGFNAGLHPKAAAMMERIGTSDRGAGGMSPTLSQLDQLRQQIGRDVASSNDQGERRMGTIMRNVIDDHIASMPGTEDLTHARDLNTRVSKLRSLDNLDEAATDRAAATGTGANGGNALRQNIIRFQRDTPNLTPDEAAATQTAIRGGPAQNALRAVGSLSPEGGTVRAATSIATGAMSHGVIPGVGYVAKRVSDALAERNVQKLRDLIATGGDAAAETARQLSAAAATDPAARELQAQLANDLSVQAGVQGTAQQQPVAATYPR